MVQELTTKPSLFGRLGQGLARGIVDVVPKELERRRLASGLQSLEQEKGLSPFQQFSRLAAIPGITPQMIQSGSDLLRQQGLRNAYAKGGRQENQEPMQANIPGQDLNDIQFAQKPGHIPKRASRGETIPQDFANRQDEAMAQQGAARENPLEEKFKPAGPFGQERYEKSIDEAFQTGRATTFQEAQAYAEQQKQRYEEAPEKYRAQLDYQKKIDDEVDDLFDKQLATRLQKEGAETFKDVSGDLQLNIKKQARNAVAEGRMTPQEAAEHYSKSGLDLVKTKGQVNKIANRDVLDYINPGKKAENVKKLISIGKSYSDMGSSEEYYDQLQAATKNGGLNLSPAGAGYIAYPPTKGVESFIKNSPLISTHEKDSAQESRKVARELMQVMTPKDSFQSIARRIKEKRPFFNERAFFDYLRENKEELGLNARLKREIDDGAADFFPHWGDIGLFPAF